MDKSRSERMPLFAHTGELHGPDIQSDKASHDNGSVGLLSEASSDEPIRISEADQEKKLSVASTVFFIMTGVMLTLPLPQAFHQAGLISGILIMVAIAGCVSYQAVAIGRCWLILTEKWPEKYGHDILIRRPYPSIAYEATGWRWLFYVCEGGINFTNFGVGLVDLLIAAQSLHCTLLPHVKLNIKEWLMIVTVVMWPLVLLGAPMESWIVGWVGGFGCLIASFLLIVALAVASAGGGAMSGDPIVGVTEYFEDMTSTSASVFENASAAMTSVFENATTALPHGCTSDAGYTDTINFESFGIGFSTLLFAFAGLSLFPTFQHDMKEPRKWWKAALSAYGLICSFSIVTAILGYTTYRGTTRGNILDNIVEPQAASILAKITSAIFVMVYLANGVVAFIPVTADIEEAFELKKKILCVSLPYSDSHFMGGVWSGSR
eukprot:scpid50659/ scgid21771/ 